MAILFSVTVSIAALTRGTLRQISSVSFVLRSTSAGTTSDA